MSLVDIQEFLNSDTATAIDVRSPGEFRQGHIPSALNVPLFDDAQRHEVGTLYKQAGRSAAMIRGLQIAGENAGRFLQAINELGVDKRCFVHCWRGGMRSEGFTWFLRGCEFEPRRIKGGYKAYRRFVHQCFAEPRRLIILAGDSGAGKTRILQELRENGQQVIDLEGLANHRGSAFGGIGQPEQPTVEQFENHLFDVWRNLDPQRPIWLECESRSVGKVFLPQPLWDQMGQAPAVFLEVDRAHRVEFLVQEYGDLPMEEFELAIRKIAKRLGGDRLQAGLQALANNDLRTFAGIALDYYDRAYRKSQTQHPRSQMKRIQLQQAGQVGVVDELSRMADDLLANSPSEA